MKKNQISSSKNVFAKFLQLYLHSWRARLVFWFAVFEAGQPQQKIEYRSSFRIVNYSKRLWIAHKPRFDKAYDSNIAVRLVVFLALFGSLVVLMQLFYPSDKALPLASIKNGGFVGFSSQEDIERKLNNLDGKAVSVQTPTTTVISSYQAMGLSVDEQGTFSEVSSYTLFERLIPFSILLNGNQDTELVRKLDKDIFAVFTDKVIQEATQKPINAHVTITNTKLNVKPAKDGFAYRQESLEKQLVGADIYSDNPLIFKPDLVAPSISTMHATSQADKMQRRIDTPLSVLAGGNVVRYSSEQIASWVNIKHKPNQGEVEIRLNQEKILDTLSGMKSRMDRDPIPVEITLLNGVEAGRTAGKQGASLNSNKLATEIADIGFSPPPNFWGQIESIAPPEVTHRRYSRDSQGLQSLVDYWTSTKPGSHGIYFRTTDGMILATKNPDQQFGINGLAGIFIAHQIYGRIYSGNLSPSTSTSLGSSVGACLRSMVYQYDPSCTSVLGNIVGWSSSNKTLREQGFGNTSLANGVSSSTASDISFWLNSILNRSITTSAQTDELIREMSIQTQRSGIPSGSLGIQVANQSGISSNGVTVDYGIVFHPRDNYTLSVLSTGTTFSDIADLTREINAILNE